METNSRKDSVGKFCGGMKPILCLAICFATLGLSEPQALADFYSSGYFNSGYYSNYGGRSRSQPILSLSLDPKEILNSGLRIAAREEREEDVLRFLRQKADINSRSDVGETALMYAARNCSTDIVKILLSHGADVNIEDREGRTALIYAAQDSCAPVIEKLLRRTKASINHRDKSGRSAIDYAREGASLDVDGPSLDAVRLLESGSLVEFRAPEKPRANAEVDTGTRVK